MLKDNTFLKKHIAIFTIIPIYTFVIACVLKKG